MRKLQVKCKKCGTKNRPRYLDKKKGKWIYICKNCGFKYTEGDKRTIEDKYDCDVLVFIRKMFTKKFMSFEYNSKVLKERLQHKRPKSTESKMKINRNMHRYSFEYIYNETKKAFPNKEIPSVCSISYYHRKLYGVPYKWTPISTE